MKIENLFVFMLFSCNTSLCKENSNEVTLGLTLSGVVLNSLLFPISFEYIKSDSD